MTTCRGQEEIPGRNAQLGALLSASFVCTGPSRREGPGERRCRDRQVGEGGGRGGQSSGGAPGPSPSLRRRRAGWTLRVAGRGARAQSPRHRSAQASPRTAASLEEVFAALSRAAGSGVAISSGQGPPGLPVDPQDGLCPPFSRIRPSLGQDRRWVVLGVVPGPAPQLGERGALQTGLHVEALAQGRLCPAGSLPGRWGQVLRQSQGHRPGPTSLARPSLSDSLKYSRRGSQRCRRGSSESQRPRQAWAELAGSALPRAVQGAGRGL